MGSICEYYMKSSGNDVEERTGVTYHNGISVVLLEYMNTSGCVFKMLAASWLNWSAAITLPRR